MLLKAQNIFKSYGDASNKVDVLRNVSLEVSEGESLAIVGPSGVGKSTLLHILGGLDRPNQGEVYISGESFYDLSDQEQARLRNDQVGFIFQFYHLLPELSALENVMIPELIRLNRGKDQSARKRAEELLDTVGLAHRLTHRSNQLSGGEQQRVAIARAMMNQPRVIMCDEPTGNLDSQSGEKIIELLLQLNATKKQTLVMITHDHAMAQKCQRTLLMNDGKLV